jgi:hypothetical protein
MSKNITSVPENAIDFSIVDSVTTLKQANISLNHIVKRFRHYGPLVRKVARSVRLLELNVKTIKAEIYKATKYMASGASTGTASTPKDKTSKVPKITDDGIKAAIRTDVKVLQAEKALIDAKEAHEDLLNLIEALKLKQEGVIEISRNLRLEETLTLSQETLNHEK